jgi:hypothetical protein
LDSRPLRKIPSLKEGGIKEGERYDLWCIEERAYIRGRERTERVHVPVTEENVENWAERKGESCNRK